MSGILITFEGGEGSGKTTQIQSLVKWLESEFSNTELVVTREPGGTEGAELIRDLLVRGASDRWQPITEALLMSASRHEHIKNVIEPALAQNKIVISDRFFDSTTIYQGIVGGVDAQAVATLTKLACGNVIPDLTFLMDMDAKVGLARAGNRDDDETRFEEKGLSFHQKVRDAFLKLAHMNENRFVIVDATKTTSEIADIIRNKVATLVAMKDAG
ncbi:dTMP kinase [Candidatus Puniceispirillum marinum]|uniref:Thymidylate kinase n=1 Tax=Puniceispirillum marinum (strain IMCC1322) TaxID=488538 RepID=D5BQA1_PUNMI|nr:dTMP kinase [Candidatus Puniceispirillum marinum]ADE38599.1 thymidylate kinase [Candidatus Puniceispirillum marinum IMCC1322]